MNRNSWNYDKIHQLLILGNGFDLNNNVKSKFSNFIDNKFTNLKKLERHIRGNNETKSYVLLQEILNLIFYNKLIPNTRVGNVLN